MGLAGVYFLDPVGGLGKPDSTTFGKLRGLLGGSIFWILQRGLGIVCLITKPSRAQGRPLAANIE